MSAKLRSREREFPLMEFAPEGHSLYKDTLLILATCSVSISILSHGATDLYEYSIKLPEAFLLPSFMNGGAVFCIFFIHLTVFSLHVGTSRHHAEKH